MPALGKELLRIGLYAIGLTSLAALVMLAGPLIAIGGYRPLENTYVQLAVVTILFAAGAAIGGWQFFRRKKSAEKLAEGIAQAADESDAAVLKDRMKDALATLKRASGSRANYLYDLPWYLLIGPPGAGKTTALVNSGLKFPLSRGATPAAIAGVGGTRYCDWWFTEDAVLIDTAGRYTTQDSDAKADQKSWFAFLDLLKKNRPRQPINGVMVAISLEDLMTASSAEINAHANAIRARLLELHDRLKVDFPVYALFTKADLVAGFMEFFGHLGEQGRRQVWGATFQTNDKTRNLVGEVPVEFDALIERLNRELTDRLQEEPAPNTRVSLFGFPAQMATLKRTIFDFLNQIFEPTRYHANATLRGFYFTSGTQQGTPIDQLIGAIARSFGAEEIATASYSGLGKSYFLTDLITRVVIGEAAWVSTDVRAVRRARILKAAAYASLFLLTAGLVAVWTTSYMRNRALIAQTDAALADYRAAAGPLAEETKIADRDFGKILPALHRLRYLPAGYATQAMPTPLMATFGLSQRERLQSSSETAYRLGLERMFRSRLIYRLEEQLEANLTNPSFIYEALKVYLMLGGLYKADRDLIVSWMQRDWTEHLYPGAANSEGRRALEQHLVALLDLEGANEPLIELNGPLVEQCQRLLARLTVADRAYELLKSRARAQTSLDWIPARKGGPDFANVFEAAGRESVEDIRIPGFFTYDGFHRLFLDQLSGIAEQIKEESWVLGEAGKQSAVAAQYDSLPLDLLARYEREFIATWQATLDKLRLKRLTTGKPRYEVLAAARAPTSPLKQILTSIVEETSLTRPRAEPAKPAAGGAVASAPKAPVLPALLQQGTQAPGGNVEAAFRGYRVVLEGDGSRKAIDAVIANLADIYQSLVALDNPTEAARANANLATQITSLRANANLLPAPFSQMLMRAAGIFEGDNVESARAQLNRALGEVSGVCNQIVPNRYPFDRRSRRDVPLVDFARLFGPQQIIDKFYKEHLTNLVDVSGQQWRWRKDHPLARTLSQDSLVQFQYAAQIRDAFFATGGSMPAINLTVIPPPVAGITAKFEVNGMAIESKGTSTPGAIQWPGAASLNRTAITVASTDFFGSQPSVLEQVGAWSLFRLIDAAGPVSRGDRLVASFVVGGQVLQYQFSTGSSLNPLNLPALRSFRCPQKL
jgi:type VI secretion system protein ImpL